ncbi:YxlC family protein [Cytobacillus sp. FJAT-54145]|uniref:YxlC family protein n=1 Tax=Cytobacillus spartinae TaxID=3299023 RepID=A0ABW6KA79_9BACI
MKERKNGQLDHDQDEAILKSIEEIEIGLEKLDSSFHIETPNIEWFEQMVVQQKSELRKKLIRDVTIFVIVALIIVSTVLFTLQQLPVVFLILQVFASIFVITYSALRFKKQVNET